MKNKNYIPLFSSARIHEFGLEVNMINVIIIKILIEI